MEKINRILVLLVIIAFGQYAMAQPPARKQEQNKSKSNETQVYEVPLSERAKSQYPKNEVPTDVVWKRDLYRVLDLEKEKNAALYYPVEPIGENMNLFTYIFRLILDKSITAYTYNLDGYESFTPENRIKPQDMLDNHRIYYEVGEDSTFIVSTSDIPSGEVLSYYIKESYYFDQRTATYNHRVTAICPVLHRAENFGGGESGNEVTKYPLFWLNYDEIAPLLARQPVMTSSYNNVSSMNLDDYFAKHSYEGEIYKTVNLRNLAISQYCKDSTEIKKEQEKIEQQLKDFRTNLWNTKTVAEMRQDSIKAANEAESANSKTKKTTGRTGVKRTTTRSSSTAKSSTTTKSSSTTKKTGTTKTSQPKKEKSSGGSGSANVSVRRTRR